MKKSIIGASIIVLLLLGGCTDSNELVPDKKISPAPVTVTEEQKQKQEEQERQWEEDRKLQEQMNQDAINTMTMMLPAIM
jgi:outer membrane biogenesis lipoprotein LolB